MSESWRRSLGTLATALLLLLGASPAVRGQTPGIEAFPNVGGGGPPEWVTPGLRLSYYGEAASIQTSLYTYVEDENGDWEDPVTHKRYKRVPENEMPTAAGRAYTQSDVIAVDGDDVIMSTVMYGIDLEDGRLSLIPLWGGRYPGAAINGAWVRPDLLAQVASGGNTDLRVLRGPYQLGDRTVQAVGFMSKVESTYASTVFDEASGVQVAYTGVAKGPGSPVHGPTDNPEGNISVGWARLVGVRQRDLPGLGEGVPDWVRPGVVLRYTGTATIDTTRAMPYGYRMTVPVEATVVLDEVGRDWATFSSETRVTYEQATQSSQATGATGSVGQYWCPPAALGRLRTGDTLDEDPVTGARLTVDAVDPERVTLRTEMPGVTVVATYDPVSGAMTSMTIDQPAAYTTTELWLASID